MGIQKVLYNDTEGHCKFYWHTISTMESEPWKNTGLVAEDYAEKWQNMMYVSCH